MALRDEILAFIATQPRTPISIMARAYINAMPEEQLAAQFELAKEIIALAESDPAGAEQKIMEALPPPYGSLAIGILRDRAAQ